MDSTLEQIRARQAAAKKTEQKEEQIVAKVQHRLEQFQELHDSLKGKSEPQKIGVKERWLSANQDIEEKVFSGDTNHSTKLLFTHYAVWHFDVGNVEKFIELCKYGIQQNLPLPDVFASKENYTMMLLYKIADHQAPKGFDFEDGFFMQIFNEFFVDEQGNIEFKKLEELHSGLNKSFMQIRTKFFVQEVNQPTASEALMQTAVDFAVKADIAKAKVKDNLKFLKKKLADYSK